MGATHPVPDDSFAGAGPHYTHGPSLMTHAAESSMSAASMIRPSQAIAPFRTPPDMTAIVRTPPRGPSADRPSDPTHVNWPQLLTRFMDYLVSECGLARNTIDAYRRDLLEFISLLDDRDVCSASGLTINVVQSYLVRLNERKLSLSTIARHLVSVRMFARYLHITGVISDDLTTQLETPKKWHKLPHTLNRTQTDAILAAPQPGEPFFFRDRALLELLYATGMRVSELAGLRVRDLNLDVGYLRCFGKGHKERIIPIGSHAIEALRGYLTGLRRVLTETAADVEHVFVSRTGRPMDRTNIWRLVSRYAAAAGINGPVGPHTLRHCFATHMLEGGADLRIVQELLGHATVTTTQIYTHVDMSRLKGLHSKCHPRQ